MPPVQSAAPGPKRDRLLRMARCVEITGLSKSTLYGLIRRGEFVRPIQVTARCVAYSEAAVMQWVQDRLATTSKP